MRPEAALEKYFRKTVKNHGFLEYKFTSGVTGVPDRIVVGNGMTAFVELKAKDGKLSERQKIVIQAIRRHGGTVFVPFSKQDVDEIMTFIEEKGAR